MVALLRHEPAPPSYWAVSVRLPPAPSTTLHVPDATLPDGEPSVPVQRAGPSETLNVPVGANAPALVTVMPTVTGWPSTDGSGVSPVIAVVVFSDIPSASAR